MALINLRRRAGAPSALITLASFLATLSPVGTALAETGGPPPGEMIPYEQFDVESTDPAPAVPARRADDATQSGDDSEGARNTNRRRPDSSDVGADGTAVDSAEVNSSDAVNDAVAPEVDTTGASPAALPTGGDKSGVTSKTISVPKGAGSIKGMEESFSAQLSTGIATFSVPFALPKARGLVSQSLGLSYSSSGGSGLAGMGWSVGVPFIARQTDKGTPQYADFGVWTPEQDRFVFNGGQELVPICDIGPNLECEPKLGALGDYDTILWGEDMPSWATPVGGQHWQYFRARVEGSFMRFFWSPDRRTWVVQSRDGTAMELGVPLNGTEYEGGLEWNPDDPYQIYRWCVTRQYDPLKDGLNRRNNTVEYRYQTDEGMMYLSDIYASAPVGSYLYQHKYETYAHHTKLHWEQRPDRTVSYRAGWKIEQNLRLARVDVASKTFNGTIWDDRAMARKYHLKYRADRHISMLESVQVEGRCPDSEGKATEADAPKESNEVLPDTNCPRLPPMTFGYSDVAGYTTSGSPSNTALLGYEAFDERIRQLGSSPPHSVDEGLSDLFDINSDGLPDVLTTAAGLYNGKHAVFFNQGSFFSGDVPMGVAGVLGANTNVIKLSNNNVRPLDLDSDARIDLLHMPKVKTYAVYAPAQLTNGEWEWQGRTVATADGQNPKIDFTGDALETKVVDVNFDGLVDVVVSTGTEYQTFFSLGRYPGGDGQFGSARWTSATTAELSNEPVRTCVPHSGLPIRFSDPDVKLADMNGDGIVDIVRVRRGNIIYWPGRGNGVWGTGDKDNCPAGTFGANRHLTMTQAPYYSDIQETSLRLDDVNGDGLTDLVQVRFNGVDVWLNIDGDSWTERKIISGTPASPSYANRVRLVDVNGSGTRDILWGNANNYQYIDLSGGRKPRLLTHVDNGLGKTTDIEYTTAAIEMLAAEAAGDPWQYKAPITLHMVKSVVERDNVDIAGGGVGEYVTEYEYRDPYYDGQQREFRGFGYGVAHKIGDANSPTSHSASTFLLGDCVDEDPNDGIDACSVGERWRDNPREALKGLPVISETYDDDGVYLSTSHTKYRLRQLYKGLDGRDVRWAYQTGSTSFVYDTADFTASSGTESLPTIELEPVPKTVVAGTGPEDTVTVPVRSTAGMARLEKTTVSDYYGHHRYDISKGCVGGAACPSADEEITAGGLFAPRGQAGNWTWRRYLSSARGELVYRWQHWESRNSTRFNHDSFGRLTNSTVTYFGANVPTLARAAGGAPARRRGSPPDSAYNQQDEPTTVTGNPLTIARGTERSLHGRSAYDSAIRDAAAHRDGLDRMAAAPLTANPTAGQGTGVDDCSGVRPRL